MPFASIVTTVMMTAFGLFCVYFAVDYGRRSIQNTPHSYSTPTPTPTPEPRQNNDVVEGYDSKPRTSKRDENSSARLRKTKKCAICLEGVMNEYVTTCNHEFHKQCIEQWKEECRSSSIPCPVCRNRISSS